VDEYEMHLHTPKNMMLSKMYHQLEVQLQYFLQHKKNVCHGKFDFVKSSAPYSVIIKILNELCSLLEVEHSRVSTGPDVVSILSTLLPRIHTVIATTCNIDDGKNSERIEFHERKMGSEWGFEKLKHAICTFVHKSVAVISSESKHPLILYLDDLQWADESSLDLMKSILNNTNSNGGFIFIGSYRENDIADEDCHFSRLQRTIHENSNYTCTKIPLENLTLDDVTNLLSNIPQMPRNQSKGLGRLVYAVTSGNPFFVWRYILQMSERNWIFRNDDKHGWIYEDNTRIPITMNTGEDVISFLMEEISNLRPVAFEALKLGSILGPEVDISILELILSKILTPEISNEPITAILEYLESKLLIVLKKDKTLFHFQHDRIYQAAFQLVSQEHNLEQLSLRIGRIILGIDDQSQGSTCKFRRLLALDQLNRGRVHIDTMDGKEELAKLNLNAAQEVLQMSAFKLAQHYLEVSLELLGGDCWESHYALTLKISNVLASVLSGNGLMSQSLLLIEEINERCKSSEDRRDTQIIKLDILACTNQLDRCLEESQKMLTELRFPTVPLNPRLMQIVPAILGVKRMLKRHSVEDILAMPLCNDKRIQHIMKIRK
jgi:predicted ATPase